MTDLLAAMWMLLDPTERVYYRLAVASGFAVVFACSAARATYWHMQRDTIERGVVTIGKWAVAVALAALAIGSLRDLSWL